MLFLHIKRMRERDRLQQTPRLLTVHSCFSSSDVIPSRIYSFKYSHNDVVRFRQACPTKRESRRNCESCPQPLAEYECTCPVLQLVVKRSLIRYPL